MPSARTKNTTVRDRRRQVAKERIKKQSSNIIEEVLGENEVLSAIKINGMNYKIGLMGLVFMEIDNDWVRSNNYTAEQLQSEHRKRLKKSIKAKNKQ